MRTQLEWKVDSQTPRASGPSSRPARASGGRRSEGSEDRLGRDAAHPDQPGHAIGEHARLAAAGTGEHEQRALGGLDRLLLLGVQTLEKRIGEHGEKLREEGSGDRRKQ
jgi:hypothetical protein